MESMSDKEALQEIVFMVNDYVNNKNSSINKSYDLQEPNYKFINNLILFLEENVIHCAMDNNYK